MEVTNHSLSQISAETIDKLSHDELLYLANKLLKDLKEARDRLNQNPSNSSKPSSSMPPWEKGGVDKDGEADADAENHQDYEKRLRCWAHLLRKAKGLAESTDTQAVIFGKLVLNLMQACMSAVYQWREEHPSIKEGTMELTTGLQPLLEAFKSQKIQSCKHLYRIAVVVFI